MAANQTACLGLEYISETKSLLADKKITEEYLVGYGEICFGKKMYTNGLNFCLLVRD